jgi:hypothetical protein
VRNEAKGSPRLRVGRGSESAIRRVRASAGEDRSRLRLKAELIPIRLRRKASPTFRAGVDFEWPAASRSLANPEGANEIVRIARKWRVPIKPHALRCTCVASSVPLCIHAWVASIAVVMLRKAGISIRKMILHVGSPDDRYCKTIFIEDAEEWAPPSVLLRADEVVV